MKSDDLKKNIWSKSDYYRKIAQAEDFSHPGFELIRQYCAGAKNILDVGCGDGSKLVRLAGKGVVKIGYEVSKKAIEISRKKYPAIKFVHGDGETIGLPDDGFDVVVSLFVLEHTNDPGKVITEMIRVAAPAGLIAFLAPNFGAPNRASPNFRTSRWLKLICGFLDDFAFWRRDLSWQKVTPRIRTIEEFVPDLDTTVEPYLGSLIRFLGSYQVTIIEVNSFWNQEKVGAKTIQKLLRRLGEVGIYPFTYWGPHMLIICRKK